MRFEELFFLHDCFTDGIWEKEGIPQVSYTQLNYQHRMKAKQSPVNSGETRTLSPICPFRIRETCSGIRFSKIKRDLRKRRYEMQKSLEINQKCNEKGHQDTNIRQNAYGKWEGNRKDGREIGMHIPAKRLISRARVEILKSNRTKMVKPIQQYNEQKTLQKWNPVTHKRMNCLMSWSLE